MAIIEQMNFDFSAPLIDEHSITQPSPVRVLVVIEAPILSAEQSQVEVFLSKQGDALSRNIDHVLQGRSL